MLNGELLWPLAKSFILENIYLKLGGDSYEGNHGQMTQYPLRNCPTSRSPRGKTMQEAFGHKKALKRPLTAKVKTFVLWIEAQ